MTLPVTILIPLYRSMRFADTLCQTIATHLDAGFPVRVSDRNGDQDCTDMLRRRFGGHAGFAIDCRNDDEHWVANMNGLIAAAKTPYFRILPHDDIATAHGTARLANALENDPRLVLAFGQIRAHGADGERLPQRDQLNQDLRPGRVRFDPATALGLFWNGRCGGAFKGVARRLPAQRVTPIWIRPTPSLAHSERIWLCAMGLLGDFHFLPETVLEKRYYPDSTHAQWSFDAREHHEAAGVLINYVDDLIPDMACRARALITHNRDRHTAWLDAGSTGSHPGFETPA